MTSIASVLVSMVAVLAAPMEPAHMTLDDFYTFLKDRGRDVDPKKVFTETDGVIRISGEEWGCITSREEYSDYHLSLEFKWGDETWGNRSDRARDSGVLLHSTGEDGGYSGTWMHSIECQIIEGGTGDILVVGDQSEEFMATCPVAKEKQGSSFVFEQGGKLETINGGRINWWGRDPKWADVLDFRGERDVELPVGEWNRLECIAVGQTITILLNGVLVNQCVDVAPLRGRLQIQSEGAEIFVRGISLQPLTNP